MQHRPRKRFGQNFLTDSSVIQSIIHSINPQPSDQIVEIGPGLGALTQPLLKTLDTLTVIEIDRDLVQHLNTLKLPSTQTLHVIQADALSIDYSTFSKAIRLVGNLPYNISTPLMMHLLDYKHAITDMHFMLQKEVVERIAAVPGSKSYGRLSIILQYHCDVEYLFTVPPESFFPAPKVDSAILRLTPRKRSPYTQVCTKTLQYVVAMAFRMRRKTLANNLKPLLNAQEIFTLDIDPGKRPEQITIHEYIRIALLILDRMPQAIPNHTLGNDLLT